MRGERLEDKPGSLGSDQLPNVGTGMEGRCLRSTLGPCLDVRHQKSSAKLVSVSHGQCGYVYWVPCCRLCVC